jgi:hypothetical protein
VTAAVCALHCRLSLGSQLAGIVIERGVHRFDEIAPLLAGATVYDMPRIVNRAGRIHGRDFGWVAAAAGPMLLRANATSRLPSAAA